MRALGGETPGRGSLLKSPRRAADGSDPAFRRGSVFRRGTAAGRARYAHTVPHAARHAVPYAPARPGMEATTAFRIA